jgi:excisionase family DNA binding protein
MKREDISDSFLSTIELAELLGVTETAVRIWVFRRQVPHLKINGRLRFRKSEILSWAESQRRVTPDEAIEAARTR